MEIEQAFEKVAPGTRNVGRFQYLIYSCVCAVQVRTFEVYGNISENLKNSDSTCVSNVPTGSPRTSSDTT